MNTTKSNKPSLQKVVMGLILIALLAILLLPTATASAAPSPLTSRPPNWVGPCTVKAFPGSNGPFFWEHTKYLDVYGVPTGGYFFYMNGSDGGSMYLSPWGPVGNATRYGVSTRWVLLGHLNWASYNWYYSNWSGCDLRKGY